MAKLEGGVRLSKLYLYRKYVQPKIFPLPISYEEDNQTNHGHGYRYIRR